MLKIKLYVILSTILVFNLFEESCARGGGGKTIGRRNKFCRGGSGGGSGGPSGSIDCKYFLKRIKYTLLLNLLPPNFNACKDIQIPEISGNIKVSVASGYPIPGIPEGTQNYFAIPEPDWNQSDQN